MGDREVMKTKGGVIHPQIERVMRKIGEDISIGRRVRKIAADDFARRIGISRATLHRLENGDPGIAFNTVAMALHALGRLDALANIADAANDHVTMMQMKNAAPKRISKLRPVRRLVLEVSGETNETEDAPKKTLSKYVGF
ncbi:XRE family transcriptional regulator [Sinorhizobium meliloti]|uniref:helix-turn-helix domain-containing protein n=1 Tax=Rhizobium meliloti TaxID=382 RepID=UPI000FDAE0CC|nr:helix-turn-helix transcriptional regulator [Sinorhizobium meliloti]RVH69194.1 XRE family transcriptional regulator [Sinorhizobium meliloti]